MKTLMSLMLGLSLLVGATVVYADDAPPKKEKKKGKKKKTDETPKKG